MADLTTRRGRGPTDLGFTLRDAVAPVFRQGRLATIVFLGIFLGALISLLLMPRHYEAEMKILVNRDRVDAVVTPNEDVPVMSEQLREVTEEDINSEVELLKSHDLLEQVVTDCGLETAGTSAWQRFVERASDAIHGVKPSAESRMARAVQSLDNRLIVEPLKKTTLIRATYAARDAGLAARVLQSLAAHYQEKHAAVHRPPGTFDFFNQEADRYRAELASAEAQLTEFNAQEGVVSAPAQKQLVLQQLSQFEAEWQQAQTRADEARERAAALAARAASLPDRQTTQVRKLDNEQLLAGLESTLLSLELKQSEMLAKYDASYPPVQAVETQIADARKAIAQAQQSPLDQTTTDRPPVQDWIATELAKAQTDQAALQAQAAATARVVKHYEQAAQALDEKGAQEDDLARDVKTAEDNYLLYLRKREEARISDALDRKRIVNVSIAEAATVPALPTLSLAWVLIGGFFVASVSSVGTAYAVDRLDTSFRTPDELGRYLDVKVLASIPTSGARQ
jgi:uncharacterized protein involved in exopolysaccharide biosynthesis